jgi:hypothetical protein
MEPTIKMLEKALDRWHTNLYSDTKNLTGRDKHTAKGKVAMIEHVSWWLDAVRRGEVKE